MLLPRGLYLLNSTVFVPPCGRLIGVGQPLSTVMVGPEGLLGQDMRDPRLDAAFPAPLIQFESGDCPGLGPKDPESGLPPLGSVLFAIDVQTWDVQANVTGVMWKASGIPEGKVPAHTQINSRSLEGSSSSRIRFSPPTGDLKAAIGNRLNVWRQSHTDRGATSLFNGA